MLIGGLAGVISRSLTAPFELAKIQQQNKFMPYTSLFDVIRKEGILGLWKGNFSNCIRIFPQMAINYTVFKYSQDILSPLIYNTEVKNFMAGSIAGMVAMTLIYPLENARSRLSLQTNKDHYKNLIDVFRKTPTLQLYNGLKMSLIGFTPYTALNFMFYHKYKEILSNYNFNSHLLSMVAGGLSGASAVTFTYPTDLIRRRLQLQGFDSKVPRYNGIYDCIKKIYTKEGINGLYRGLGMCYLKIFPAVALQFWVMELGKEYLTK